MPRFKRSMAVFAAVSAAAAVAAAPAGAQVEITWNAENQCVEDLTLPSCVDYTFDTANWAVDTTRTTYNEDVQPVLDGGACLVYETATGQPCPSRGFIPKLP